MSTTEYLVDSPSEQMQYSYNKYTRWPANTLKYTNNDDELYLDGEQNSIATTKSFPIAEWSGIVHVCASRRQYDSLNAILFLK